MKNKTLKNKPDKPKSLTKLVFSIIAKTVMAVFFILGFLIISVSVIAPGVMAPTYDALGLNKATYLIYKRVYNREATKENLYNLIQLSIENKEYEDQVTYIKQMLDDEEFADFAEEIDEATKKSLGKRYSIYADSYESYLRKHIVIALYSTGRELEAKMMAIDSVYGSVDELYVYVNLVVNDTNLIEMQKESELQTLYSRYGIINASGETDPLMLKKKELLKSLLQKK